MAKSKIRKDVTDQFVGHRFDIKDIKFTPKQRELIRIINDTNTKVVFLTGCAGTAKTFCAVFCGLRSLQNGTKDKIKYIRSLVESSASKIGFLKGSLEEKISPYGGPLMDKLEELTDNYSSKRLIDEGTIVTMCPNFLRGATFKNDFVIIDESQNLPFSDLVTVISRIGENSTLVFCSDQRQSDIKNSGIGKLMELFEDDESKDKGIHTFKFSPDDIMRSEILKFIMGRIEK